MLPDDDRQLRKFSRMTPKQWSVNRDVIMQFWASDGNGRLYQKRLSEGRFRAALRASVAASGGRAKALKYNNRPSNQAGFKQSLSTANHNQSDKDKESPLPPNPANGFHNGQEDFLNLIDDDGWMDARAHAPGWDVHALARIYGEGVRGGALDMPRNVNKAFPAWVRAFTKGKRPG